MSVEVKTPTRTQFEHVEFQCGEKQTCSPFHHSEKLQDAKEDGEKCQNLEKQREGDQRKPAKQVTILEPQQLQKSDGPKQENVKYLQRRRRFSTPAQRGQPHYGPGFRKRRYSTKPDKIVLPTKFLLGGNISDPLNLNSLYDDETGLLLNQKTPNCSPLPFPSHRENVNLVIPPNITDPLNLNSGEDIDESTLRFMAKKRRRYKHKKKQDEQEVSSSSITATPVKETEKKKNLTLALKIDIEATHTVVENKAESDSELMVLNQKKCGDKIVSPVIPQSSKSRKRRRTISECTKPEYLEVLSNARRALLRTESVPFDQDVSVQPVPPASKKVKRQVSATKTLQPPKPQTQTQTERCRKKSGSGAPKKFIYGNYNRYYGYRNPELEPDIRLSCLKPEWFDGKDVLDIGCNVGHITLAVARDFKPRKIIGMDIDGKLISAARKNIRHYMSTTVIKTDKFPVSAKLNYGPILAPSVGDLKSCLFPNNILFQQGNYVLDFDELLDVQKEEYDVIMALSVTKWIHLNFGDAGLKRFFKRICKQLRPGGRLVLEPQAWPSYKKKKKLTDAIFTNFKGIQFKPDQFTDFLLSREVGFSTCEAIEVPYNKSVGFRRPIQLFRKPDTNVNSPNPAVVERDADKLVSSSVENTSAFSKSNEGQIVTNQISPTTSTLSKPSSVLVSHTASPLSDPNDVKTVAKQSATAVLVTTTLVSCNEKTVTNENPLNDFPNRISASQMDITVNSCVEGQESEDKATGDTVTVPPENSP